VATFRAHFAEIVERPQVLVGEQYRNHQK
jgi:hypothetical protein